MHSKLSKKQSRNTSYEQIAELTQIFDERKSSKLVPLVRVEMRVLAEQQHLVEAQAPLVQRGPQLRRQLEQALRVQPQHVHGTEAVADLGSVGGGEGSAELFVQPLTQSLANLRQRSKGERVRGEESQSLIDK